MRNDTVWDDIALVFAAIFTAPLLIAWLVGSTDSSHELLLEHDLVVPAKQALLSFGAVGIDGTRIVLVSGLFAAVVIIGAMAWTHREST